MLANLSVNTYRTIEADNGLRASNLSRRLLDGARGGTLEVLGPCEGTLVAADGSNETVAIGGGNNVVGGVERHGLF